MLSRRQFLFAVVASGLAPGLARSEPLARTAPYRATAAMVFGLLRFGVTGVLEEEVDHAAGTYRVLVAGEGVGIRNRFESTGVVRQGRFTPRLTLAQFSIRGRQHQTRIAYDYDRRVVQYDHRSETFFLGRVRTGQNTFGIPEGETLDDFASIILNHGAGLFDPEGRVYRALIVNRAHRRDEGVDEVQADGARGAIAPISVSYSRDPQGAGTVSAIDLSGVSTWAKPAEPARFTFTADRRIERIEAHLIFGTTIEVTISRA